MSSLVRRLAALLELVATVAFTLLFLGIFLAVMLRYVLNLPIVWSEELAGVAATWMVFCGAAVAVFRAEHINVDMLLRLPFYRGEIKRFHEAFMQLVVLLFAAALAVAGFRLGFENFGRELPALRWPYAILYLSSGVGGAAMVLFSAYRLFHGMRRLPSPRGE